MLKLYVSIVILAVLGIIEYLKYRHILAATVIYPIMWILSFVGIILKGNEYYEISWIMPLIVVLGYILFIIGFGLMYRRELSKTPQDTNTLTNMKKSGLYTSRSQTLDNSQVESQMLGLNIIMIVAIGIFVMTLYYMLQVIDIHNILDSLYSIKRMIDSNEKPFPYIVVVSRYYFRCAIWYLSLVYFKIPKGCDYKDKNGINIKTSVLIKLIVVIGMASVVMFTDISRNDILMTLLPVLFIFLLSKRLSSIKALLVSACSFAIFVVLFVIFLYFRKGAVELFKEKGVEGGEDSFYFYLTCGTPAIDQLYKNGTIKIFTVEGDGARHTFSLPAAISDMLFGTTVKPEVLQKRIRIGPKTSTNVYTYYHWLGMDFGLIYAAIFQFVFGLLYGFLYGRINNEGYIAIIWYAVLMYPLCMMFFEDQYLAIGQTWLIIMAFSYMIQIICRKSKVLLA